MKAFIRFSIVVAAATLALPAPAHAQESIRNVRIGESYAFGDSIVFEVTAQGTTVFTNATLTAQVEGLAEPLALPLEPERSALLDINHPVNVAEYGIPPFAEITYWWDLGTFGGAVYTTEPVTFRYEDNRVNWAWRTSRNKNIIVHWDGQSQAVPQIAQSVAMESLARADGLLGTVTADDVDIYVYPDGESLNAALQSHQTTQLHEGWAQAVTLPQLSVVLVSAAPGPSLLENLSRDLPHEMAHVAIGQAIRGNEAAMIPAWFNEGIAAANAQEFDPQLALTLDDALASGSLLAMAELCGPSFATLDVDTATLAYAQSASVITYIRGRYGDAALTSLFDAYKSGADCASGIQQSLGIPATDLQSSWRATLALTPNAGTVPTLSGSMIAWLALLGAGFIIGILFWIPLARRPTRRRSAPELPVLEEETTAEVPSEPQDEYTAVRLTDKQTYWQQQAVPDNETTTKGPDTPP